MLSIGPEIPPESHRKERRQHPRSKVTVGVEVQLDHPVLPLRATTAELSLGGCYIKMMFTLEVGTKLTVLLWMDGDNVYTRGIVVTRYPHLGNGIQFTEMGLEDRARLARFLTTVEERQRPK